MTDSGNGHSATDVFEALLHSVTEPKIDAASTHSPELDLDVDLDRRSTHPQPQRTPQGMPDQVDAAEERMARQFAAVTADLQTAVARTKSRLWTLVQGQLYRAFVGDDGNYDPVDVPVLEGSGAATASHVPDIGTPKWPKEGGLHVVDTDLDAAAAPPREQGLTGLETKEVEQAVADAEPAAVSSETADSHSGDPPILAGQESEPLNEVAPLPVDIAEVQAGSLPLEVEEPQIPPLPLELDEASEGDEPRYAEEEAYEGTVRLNARTAGCTCQAMYFLRKVCGMPELRLLRLVGTSRGGLELVVALREPIRLKSVLMQMERVAMVSDVSRRGPDNEEQQLDIWLVDTPSANEL